MNDGPNLPIQISNREFHQLLKRLQILLGFGGQNLLSNRAVLAKDLNSIGSSIELTATTISTAPTANDYNKLLNDVKKILEKMKNL